jgi:hypothetical protein
VRGEESHGRGRENPRTGRSERSCRPSLLVLAL